MTFRPCPAASTTPAELRYPNARLVGRAKIKAPPQLIRAAEAPAGVLSAAASERETLLVDDVRCVKAGAQNRLLLVDVWEVQRALARNMPELLHPPRFAGDLPGRNIRGHPWQVQAAA